MMKKHFLFSFWLITIFHLFLFAQETFARDAEAYFNKRYNHYTNNLGYGPTDAFNNAIADGVSPFMGNFSTTEMNAELARMWMNDWKKTEIQDDVLASADSNQDTGDGSTDPQGQDEDARNLGLLNDPALMNSIRALCKGEAWATQLQNIHTLSGLAGHSGLASRVVGVLQNSASFNTACSATSPANVAQVLDNIINQ